MIVIEKGVPLPQKQQRQPRKSRYPFEHMDVGDSFFIQEGKKNVSSSAYAYAKKTGKKFAVRKMGEAHRCWRVS